MCNCNNFLFKFHFLFTESLPDAFRTNCVKCTETQRRNARKVIFHLQDNKKADYAKLVEKYDPEGIYRSQWDNQNHQA